MGTHIKLTASDGHKFSAYRVDPAGTPKGGIVVIQEIFGVNHHIRSVADRFAALGYVAIAPALFDRIEAGFESGIRITCPDAPGSDRHLGAVRSIRMNSGSGFANPLFSS